MAIEVLYILIDCLEQDRNDHFAAWIIFFHEKAAKHNTFPFAVLTSLNSSFENVEGKKCLALLLGHMVRKQEEALRFFKTGRGMFGQMALHLQRFLENLSRKDRKDYAKLDGVYRRA